MFLLLSADPFKFFKINFFSSKNSFKNTIRVSNGLDPDQDHSIDVLSVLILAQTLCKCYQQMTKVTTSKERRLSGLRSPKFTNQ